MPTLDRNWQEIEPQKQKEQEEARAAVIRRQASRMLKECLLDVALLHDRDDGGRDINPFLDALFSLRHLQVGDIETAIRCHGLLARKLKRDLAQMAFPCEGADLLLPIFNFLDASGRWYSCGRWVDRAEYFAAIGAKDTVRAKELRGS